VVFNLGFATSWESFAIFLGVARASDKNIQNYKFYISYMEPLFVVVKIIGSPGKNDSLRLHSKFLKCDYDHHSAEYCYVWQRMHNFMT